MGFARPEKKTRSKESLDVACPFFIPVLSHLASLGFQDFAQNMEGWDEIALACRICG